MKLLSLILLICVPACGPQVSFSVPQPVEPHEGWILWKLPNFPLIVRTPPDFQQNQHGCYFVTPGDSQLLYGPGWRGLCIRLAPDEVPALSFDSITARTQADSGCMDCMIYSDVTTECLSFNGREMTVQIARGSGGIGGKRDAPEMLIKFPIKDGRFVIVHAEFGDVHDAAVILGIASTIALDESTRGNDR